MNRHAISFMYALNIILQSLFSLLFGVAIFVGIGYLLTSYLGVGSWVYIPLIVAGLGIGIVSMVRFILSAMAGLERMEEQRKNEKG